MGKDQILRLSKLCKKYGFYCRNNGNQLKYFKQKKKEKNLSFPVTMGKIDNKERRAEVGSSVRSSRDIVVT